MNRTLRMTLMGTFALIGSAGSASAQGYFYQDPVIARDSGLSCIGASATDEQNLDREATRGIYNKKTTGTATAKVYCPINRRNTTAYARQSDPPTKQHFLKLAISVRASSTTGNLSCKAIGYNATTKTAIETADVYACSTPGGCPDKPVPANFGFMDLNFIFPMGVQPKTNEVITNLGYRCYIPNGSSAVIGHEAFFRTVGLL